mgnify:CR=1 FL=1
MSRICELTGKGRQVGHNVSHANNKTKRLFLPNLQNVTLMSEKLDRSFKFRVSTHGLRSVEHNGGLDNWLLKQSDAKLSPRAVKVKRGAMGALLVAIEQDSEPANGAAENLESLALAFAAIGLRMLSMRPASIGPVKALLRTVDLAAARAVMDKGAGGVMIAPPPSLRTDDQIVAALGASDPPGPADPIYMRAAYA